MGSTEEHKLLIWIRRVVYLMLVYSVFTLDVCQSTLNVLRPLLGWTDEDVMYLDMLWSSQDVHHRVCHVL